MTIPHIEKMAETLKKKLTDEEFVALLDISGDYTTDAELYRELSKRDPRTR